MELKRIQEDMLPAFAGALPQSVLRAVDSGELELLSEVEEAGGQRTLLGVMAVSFSGDTAQIAWLCVAEQYRGQGISKRMLADFLLAASEGETLRSVHAAVPFTEENVPVLQTLSGFGFIRGETDFRRYAFPLSAFDPARLPGVKPDTVQLKSLTDYHLKVFSHQLRMRSEESVPLPILKNDYHGELSFAQLRDGEIQAILLLRETSGGQLELSFLYARDRSGQAIASLLSAAVQKARALYPAGTVISLTAVNENAEHIVNRLVPDASCTIVANFALALRS